MGGLDKGATVWEPALGISLIRGKESGRESGRTARATPASGTGNSIFGRFVLLIKSFLPIIIETNSSEKGDIFF